MQINHAIELIDEGSDKNLHHLISTNIDNSTTSTTLIEAHLPPRVFMRSLATVVILSTTSIAAHVAQRSGKWCFEGCETTINYANFNDTGPGSKKVRSCNGVLRATSLYLCIDEYCEEPGRLEWLQDANETCFQRANTPLPPYHIIDRYNDEQRVSFRRISADEAFTTPTLSEIVLPDHDFFERAFTSLV